jgi:EAL domain-containing protein (putative c-di-GMP-specific phosphodiesterase class I)
MHEACRQALKWLSEGAHGLVLSVNVSPRQFADPDFAGTVAAVLAQTGFPATRLQIEVTEGLLLDPSSDTLRKLHELVQTGVRLAVDDFGIGHSSLAYLKTFPLHTLKIDRMFVRDLQQHARDRAIARAIIELGHSLGLKVTAEGVETAEQAQTLQELGCDALQGYLFARPVPGPEFKKLLRKRGAGNGDGKPNPFWSDTMAGLEISNA